MGQSQSNPQHIAIILDGNGRWARARGLSRPEGHRAGGEALRRLLDDVLEEGIPTLSLYAFSTENWKRPDTEVTALWGLMEEFFKKYLDVCLEKGVRIRCSGAINRIPPGPSGVLKKAIEVTKDQSKLTANFCINYGSRAEIVRACNHLIKKRRGSLWRRLKGAFQPVTEAELESELYTAGMGDVDLLVRPGGEYRISNFMLWQCAYAELYFTEVYWPDFDSTELERALEWYRNRQRRFGGLGAQTE
ncbi:MAG: di-trans,poly-cis-decaprenylcistransferase [Leptospiraceae bacterium]|nr:di-trans,poly-cis-decaprenylcistransferase [Leptospiraceae bacterium]